MKILIWRTRMMILKMREKAVMKLAWLLPEELVYWATIRLIAHGTSGQYSNQEVPILGAMDALARWRTQ